MTYDQFEDFKRQQAESQAREQQRFWDRMVKEQRETYAPSPKIDPSEAVSDTLGLIGLILKVLRPVGWLLCLHDIKPPWRVWRKWTSLAGGIGIVAGIIWLKLDLFDMGGLGEVFSYLAGFVLFFAALPRTFLILTAFCGATGIYVEFFMETGGG